MICITLLRKAILLGRFFMFYNIFLHFFCRKICICQIKAVPLHSKSEMTYWITLLPVSGAGNAGERPARNIRQKNTYRERAVEKNGHLLRFRVIVLFVLKLDSMKPTYILFYEILCDLVKKILRHICDTTNR